MEFNWWLIPVTAFVPMILGFIWYNPAVFGKAWMASSGMTEEKIKGGNMAIIFGVSFLFSCMLALMLTRIGIHQVHIPSLFTDKESVELLKDSSSDLSIWMNETQTFLGRKHLTFGHGMFHGILGGIFFVLPILGTNALFERKGFKYILVNSGYWIVCIAIISGILSQWFIK